MKEITEINELHRIVLDIAKIFHTICIKHNIPYYLCGGGMLGAIRHKGFIPWDDDLDFLVPRTYFCKLINILKKELPTYYKIVDSNDDDNIFGEIVKIEDCRTVIKDKFNTNTKIEHGVFIDLFPMDYTDGSHKLLSKNSIVLNLLRLHLLSKLRAKNTKIRLVKILPQLFGKSIYIKLIKHFTSKSGPYIANYSGAYGERETIPKEWLGNSLFDFEDTQFYGIQKYDEYLIQLYGNYMELPPESKRRSHLIEIYYK